jgi:hypothetical protein
MGTDVGEKWVESMSKEKPSIVIALGEGAQSPSTAYIATALELSGGLLAERILSRAEQQCHRHLGVWVFPP